MFYFTNDQIDEIEKRLAVRAKKDTDFDAVSEAQEGDLVAIIHNGRNMICRLDKLPGRLVAKRYDEIPAEITEENILETPTAFSISVLKTLLGIEEMPEFDDDTAYEKGSYVSYTDANGILRGYVFTADKPAGYWDESKVTEINYASLSENIKDILSEFKTGGRVYVLESYFSNGKAKKAIADEDGKNIKQYYALKTDIPDVNREIAEAIAVKLDNTPKGSHEVPIYIAPDLQTGYGRSEIIDSLHLPGDIRSDLDIFAGRGVAAYGMADLALGGRGGSGTLTEIQIDGTTIPDINGVVNLPAYPSALSQFTSDTTHRLVTDSQISSWTNKYDLPTGGIPKTDLSNSVQNTLNTADSSAVTLGNLIAGLTSKGAHNLPIYFDSNTDVQEIDSLLVPGNIQSTNGGVSALGIADLSVSSGAVRGTITEIQINSVPYPDVNGIVNLPAYPSRLSELTADSIHRVVTDSQITSWTAKYDLPSGGIPKTDLSSAVQTSLGKADNALEKFSLGAHNLPIWFNSSKEPQVIDSLSVSGDIESTAGGVSANGIASLAISSGSQGTLTQIKIGDTPYPDVNGVVTLPEYPTAASLISDGLASRDWVSENYSAKSYEGRVQTIESYIPTQATSSNKLADKNFVNSSIATATATFKGTVIAVGDSEAQAQTALASITGMDANDYAFVKVENTPQVGVDKFKRYKYTGSAWSYEYTLNNSSFTAEQWAAINSGLTSTGATTITTLGTISTGEWQGTAIADDYISSAGRWNNAVTTLINLKTGLTSKGAHDLPVYLNSSAQAVAIDALSVPGDIQSIAGGVSAKGIADLSVSGGGSGTLTLIYVGDTPYPDVNGVVTLPAYPSTLDDISDGGSRKLSDYTKTTAFQTLAIKGGTTSVGSYSPISGLELSILAGSNISVTPNATNHTITIANTYSYSLPTASSGTKGGVKVGNTLDISNGVLNQKAGIVTAGTYKSVTVDTYGRVTAGTNPTTLADFGITDGVNGLQKSGSGYLSDVDFVDGNPHSLYFTFTSFAKAQIGHTGGSGTTTYKMRVKADGAWSDYLALQQAGASAWGIVTDQSQTFGGDKTFNGNIHGMQGVSAKGIATLELGGGGGSGTVTSIKFGSANVIVADNGLLSVPVGQGTSNGQIKIGGQDISVKGLAALAYKPSLSFSEITGTASDSQIPTLAISKISGLQTALDGKLATSLKGATNGLAELDANGLVPSSQLPSYVDDVLEYSSKSAFPSTGTSGKIYVALDTNLTYRWSGSAYTEISPSLALGETSSTAYRGDRGKTAYDHATETKSGAQNSGFYKFSVTAQGHISGVTAVTASDLTSLIGSTTYAPYNANGYLPLNGGTMTGNITMGKNSIKFNVTNDSDWNIGVGTSETHLRILNAVGNTATGAPSDYAVGLSVKGYYGFQIASFGGKSDNFLIRNIRDGSSEPRAWVTLYHSGNSNLSTVDWATKKLTASDQIVSTVANGTAPFVVASGTKVSNLHADKLDGYDASTIFEAFANDNDQLSATIGGTNKKVTVGYASRSTDTRTELLTGQEFIYRQTAGGGLTYKPSSAVLKRVLGNSVVWNQAVNSPGQNSGSAGTAVKNADGSFTYTKTTTGTTYPYFWIGVGTPVVIGHTYFLYFKTKGTVPSGFKMFEGYTGALVAFNASKIVTATTNSHDGLVDLRDCENGAVVTIFYSIIDLTIFFNGNIPAGLTAETFERDYGYLLANPEYNAGQLINNAAEGLETVGFNLWDEEWEVGVYNRTSGAKGSGSAVRSANLISVLPSTTYYFACNSSALTGSSWVGYCDANGNFLGSSSWIIKNSTFTTPANCHYLIFYLDGSYGTTYKYDVCINLSDSNRNGQYEPYRKVKTPLNLKETKVKSHNIWDEEWEYGAINADGTEPAATAPYTYWRAKNKTEVIPSVQYYIKANRQTQIWIAKYDAFGVFIEREQLTISTYATYTAGSNVHFIKVFMGGSGNFQEPNNDICINESSSFNGQYEPHGILTINGLKQAGSVRDEIVGKKLVKRVGDVDLGTLTFKKENSGTNTFETVAPLSLAKGAVGHKANACCSKYTIDDVSSGAHLSSTPYILGIWSDNRVNINDPNYNNSSQLEAFQNSLNGVWLNFELATPIEYEIIDEAPYEYPIDVLGTERIVSDELVAPFVADIQYGAEQRDIAVDINNLHISAGLLSNRASALESYFTDGIANNAARLSNTSAIGSTTKPVYFTANGVPSACSTYAGGTAVTLNGSSKAALTASFYAATVAGTSGQILKSTAGTPEWINQSALVAGKATQLETSRTLWGQSFNGTADIGTDKFAKMPYLLFRTITSGSDATIGYVGRDASNNVIHLMSYSGVPVSIGTGQQDDIYITTGHNIGFGTTNPSEKVHVIGNILSSGNIVANGGVAARGMATLQGGAGAGNPVTQVNIGSTPYTPSNGVVSLPAYPTWSTLSGKPTNVSAFTNDSGYIDSSALAVTFTTTTLTSSSTSVYLNNTVQRDTFQKIIISSANNNQQFNIHLTGSGSYYGYHRQVFVTNSSGKSISLLLDGANYIKMGGYDTVTNQGPQRTDINPISMDNEWNREYLLDIIQASSSEYPVVKVTRMYTWVD